MRGTGPLSVSHTHLIEHDEYKSMPMEIILWELQILFPSWKHLAFMMVFSQFRLSFEFASEKYLENIWWAKDYTLLSDGMT